MRYRNRRTGEVITTDGPQPAFDRSSRWVREDDLVDESPRSPANTEANEDGLDGMRRPELNELAAQEGVAEPEKLPNRDAVIAAIREHRVTAGGGE